MLVAAGRRINVISGWGSSALGDLVEVVVARLLELMKLRIEFALLSYDYGTITDGGSRTSTISPALVFEENDESRISSCLLAQFSGNVAVAGLGPIVAGIAGGDASVFAGALAAARVWPSAEGQP